MSKELLRYQGQTPVAQPVYDTGLLSALYAMGLEPIGYRKNGSPIMPIAGGDGRDPGEVVDLDPSTADAIAAKAAALVAAAEEPAWAKALREQNAEILKGLAAPERTDIVDGGIQEKSGQGSGPVYGGDDKYTFVGGDDLERATNLWIATQALQSTKGYRPSERLLQVMRESATKAAKQSYQGLPSYVQDGLRQKAVDPSRFISTLVGEMRAEARAKAMTSTGSTSGDEWVPTLASASLWQDIHLATEVANQFRRVDMPSNPYTLPTQTSSVTWKHASTENVAVTASNPATGSATLTAVKAMAEIDFSGELTEDSIIPVVPSLRADLVRSGAQTIDDLLVHGDSETGGTGNVNSDDAAPAAGTIYLGWNGIRKFALVTNTGQVSNVAGALTSANFNTIRALLGKYGARHSDLLVVTGTSTYLSMLTIAEVLTAEKYGAGATILRGELARLFNIPIFLSEAIPGTTTDKVDADGKYTTTSPSSNDTKGWLALVNTRMWVLGFRRDLQIESFRDIQKDQNILVASFRQAQIPSGIATTHTAVGYNVTV